MEWKLYQGPNFVNLSGGYPPGIRGIPLPPPLNHPHVIRFFRNSQWHIWVVWMINPNLSKYCWLFPVFYEIQIFWVFIYLFCFNIHNNFKRHLCKIPKTSTTLFWHSSFKPPTVHPEKIGWNGGDITGGIYEIRPQEASTGDTGGVQWNIFSVCFFF